MTYAVIDVSSGERLKASTLSQLQENMNDVRKNHIAADAPNVLETGCLFVKNNVTPWRVYQYDGDENVNVFDVYNTTNQPSFLGTAITPQDYSITSSDIASGAIHAGKIGSGQVQSYHLSGAIFTQTEIGSFQSGNYGNNVIINSDKLSTSTYGYNRLNWHSGLISGYTSGPVSITTDSHTFGFPSIKISFASNSTEIRQRSGTADPDTPGFTIFLDSINNYYVDYRYIP